MIVSKSRAKTVALGKRLGLKLRGGEVLGLVGDLGTGKTTFVKGLAKGLGVSNHHPVNSPSFVLMREYDEGRFPLYHFDAHRLTDEGDLLRLELEVGLEEYLSGGGVSVLEWADHLQSFLPEEYLKIEFRHAKETERILLFHPIGKHYEKIVKAL